MKTSAAKKTVRKPRADAQRNRQRILEVAKQVFTRRGAEASMDEIAKQADLAKGTLYLYFDSKDAIYQAVVQQALSKLAALTEEHIQKETTFAGKLGVFISVRNAFWLEQQQIYRIILSINREGVHRKRSIAWQKQAVQYLHALFEEAAKAGEIPEQDLLAAAWTTMDAIRGVNERRAFSEGRSTEYDSKFLTAFLLNALQAKE